MADAYKTSIAFFHQKLDERIKDGYSKPRKVLFAECDYSIKDNEAFLLEEQFVQYPNIVVLIRKVVVPLDFTIDSFTDNSTFTVVQDLSDSFLYNTNVEIA